MELITRKTNLSENVLAFCRYLRSKGLIIGPGETSEVLRALAVIPFDKPENFRLCMRSILPKSPSQQDIFDTFYTDYWENLARAVDSKVKEGAPEEGKKRKNQDKAQNGPSLQALKSWLYGNKEEEEIGLATYSTHLTMGQKDFSIFGEEELEEVLQIIHQLAKAIATKKERRYRQYANSGLLDIRKSIRTNLRTGGEMLELNYRKRRVKKARLVMLCDVSKSMDLYSRFLIQFIYGFQSAYRHIETFAFSTSLYHITEELRSSNIKLAMQRLAQHVDQWSGGTKIGQALFEFVKSYQCFIDKDTVVIIMSDGWDTGDLDRLDQAMAYMHKHADRVIWLNPLAGNPNYQPETGGMATAIPYIDVLASVHNIDSLKKLARSI